MFQKGEILKVEGLELVFLEDARQLGDPGLGRIAYGGRVRRAGSFGREKYYVKYVGAFEPDGDHRYAARLQSRWNMIDVQGSRSYGFASPFLAETIAHGISVCGETDINVLVLAYAEGVSLSQRIREIRQVESRGDKKSVNEAFRFRFDLIRQLLFGIRDYSQGEDGSLYVHRDLKPDNIRVHVWEDKRGQRMRVLQQLRILDFDMLLSSDEMPEEGGTSGYTHPALYFGYGLGETDSRKRVSWDLYSAGMLIYYILEGRERFSEEAFQEDAEDLFRIGSLRTEKMSPRFAPLCQMLRDMVQEEQTRYNSIYAVIADYESFLRGFYGDAFSPCLSLPHYLECIPGYEAERRALPLLCQIAEIHCEEEEENRDRLPSYRSFMVYEGTLCRLSYGDGGNLGGALLPHNRADIGVLSFMPEDKNLPLCFIPYSDRVSVVCNGKLIQENRNAPERTCQLHYKDQILYSRKDPDGNELWRVEITILNH